MKDNKKNDKEDKDVIFFPLPPPMISFKEILDKTEILDKIKELYNRVEKMEKEILNKKR